MRCKCCNKIIDVTIKFETKKKVVFEDMCTVCRSASKMNYYDKDESEEIATIIQEIYHFDEN